MVREKEIDVRGVVLAGGESSRMGREKGLMIYQGMTLIEYALAVIPPAQGKPLIISNNSEVVEHFSDIEVIPDCLIGRGPLGGIHTALRHTQDNVIIIPCDAPLLPREYILALERESADVDICVYCCEDKIYPLPGFYSLNLLPDIESRMEGAGRELLLQDMIRSTQRVRYLELEADESRLFIGINTPEDYRRVTGHDIEES